METSLGVEPLAATMMTTGPDRGGECNANREHAPNREHKKLGHLT